MVRRQYYMDNREAILRAQKHVWKSISTINDFVFAPRSLKIVDSKSRPRRGGPVAGVAGRYM